eukprot:CAMPEP_0195069026 /NCGR_PEP_ID=MMETSP0448-20130528/13476_1 /TAXON_ID=66468 /ORGANISM="Heterocapsa triquestra, Strain CCMP 448" /LENGTH=60 /DNA_ID=CAMNT_0040100583 /DNA_START=23 /DNA_END=202 /DNA_ORIENTATION=+
MASDLSSSQANQVLARRIARAAMSRGGLSNQAWGSPSGVARASLLAGRLTSAACSWRSPA